MTVRSHVRLAGVMMASLALGLVGCSGPDTRGLAEQRSTDDGPTGPSSRGGRNSTSTSPGTSGAHSTAPATKTPSAPSRPVTIAFAGDVHFESFLASRLDHPETAMGPLASALARADLSVVNLETAVTTRGTPEPKEYTFRAPPVVFTALKEAGVDVATMANNHGLDYGPVSVPDALEGASAAGMPVIGIGENAAAAYKPWIATVNGQRIAFLGATAVMDSPLIESWSATFEQPGVATALDGDNAAVVAAVKAVRQHVDTVVVELHYGSDLMACPTEIQRELADDLVRAGADIVVGQHAHIPLGGGYLGSAYVDFGMGNFQFYVSNGGETAATGVLVLTVDGREVTHPRWIPGEIVNGLPTRLTGETATEALTSWTALRACSGLTADPTSVPR